MEKKTHVIVASVILSILVWLSVSMNDEYSVALRIPFVVSNLPDGMALANAVPRTILVRVHGTGWQIASSSLSTNSSISIDASNLNSRKVVLTSRELGYSVNLGSSADVVSFAPDTVTVTMDSLAAKRVPVSTTRIEIVPRNGFTTVGEPEILPDSVTISGAKSILSRINSWQTMPRKFRNVINSIDKNIPLSDTLERLVHVDSREVNVKVTIEQIAENTYKAIPVRILNNADSVDVLLLPPSVDLTVRGGISTMTDLTPDSFVVTVDYADLVGLASSHIRPDVKVPPFLQLISVQPDSLEFVIRK